MIQASLLALLTALPVPPQHPAPSSPTAKGLVQRTDNAAPGFVLLAPLRSKKTLLVDEHGEVRHRWISEYTPGNAADLLPNGNLLRAAKLGDNERFHGGGEGGLLEEFTWNGERVWSWNLSTAEHLHHHDFEVLPNGNVLVIVWEGKTEAEARAAGRRPNAVGEAGLWPDAIWELEPRRPDGAEVVWAWHAWDHLVQDHDPALPHYGEPAEYPGRIDVNIGAAKVETAETEDERRAREEQERHLRALGYVGDDEPEDEASTEPSADRERRGADWMHTNAIDYDAELDLIVISVRNFGEVFVIDHSTTTEEAAGSEGGRYGRGGDLVWRWGHPGNRGHAGPQQLFGQHDARWTREGGRAAISVFNNGGGRPGGEYSSVDLIVTPLSRDGRIEESPAPEKAAWSYAADPANAFFSSHISGAMPLTGGRFLVCEGDDGRVFQVDRSGTILWEFASPFGGEAADRDGRGGPRPGRRPRGERERRPGAGPPSGGRRGSEGPEGPRGPGGRGGPRGGRGGPGGSPTSLFRAVHIAPEHPGLQGRWSGDAASSPAGE